MFYSPQMVLIATAIQYRGDWKSIYEAVHSRSTVPMEQGMELIRRMKSKAVTIIDPEYPESLRKECPKPPFVLFYYGDISLLRDSRRILTIVGSRNPLSYAYEKTKELSAGMAKRGYVIASGLARGIDTAAAEGSVCYPGKSIAVLGNGIDWHYPAENEELQNRIADNGLVISEYPGDESPNPRYFPTRNRILASISKATFIGEAKPHSGTLITCAFAINSNRDIGVLPNEPDTGNANNHLIQQGCALIETVADLELMMGPLNPT